MRIEWDPGELADAIMRALEDPRVVMALGRALAANRPEEPPAYATVEEFAQRHRVSTRTVRRWIRDGMPASRVGNVRRVEIRAAERWLREGGQGARVDRAAHLRAARAAGLHAVSK